MDVNPEDFRRQYASLSDAALQSLRREDLVDLARQCYDQELALRGLKLAPSTEVEAVAKDEDLILVATYNIPYEANFAHGILESAAIPSYLQDDNPINALGGLRLLVPTEFLEQAREILEAQLSDEDLAAQAEAQTQPESSPDQDAK